MRNPLSPDRRIRAVLFDVDGTLYRQRPLRLRMAAELGTLALTRPRRAPATWRALSEYRRAQETLRRLPDGVHAARQLDVAAERAAMTTTEVASIVDEWMIERPLKHLLKCRAHGTVDLLDFLTARRIRIGILSDYPAEKKLQALGIRRYFSLVLCGSDPEIGAFKPSPRGFLAASARWHLDPADVLYVGDRADADAAGAAAARMPAVIVTRKRLPASIGALAVSSLERLRDVLDDNYSR
ncbi:MAG TPA: HAD family hydrolase [Vicinamibacterales bacterium]|nr:HAD family hydrolase [Vicinamibacterales bacterium]